MHPRSLEWGIGGIGGMFSANAANCQVTLVFMSVCQASAHTHDSLRVAAEKTLKSLQSPQSAAEVLP